MSSWEKYIKVNSFPCSANMDADEHHLQDSRTSENDACKRFTQTCRARLKGKYYNSLPLPAQAANPFLPDEIPHGDNTSTIFKMLKSLETLFCKSYLFPKQILEALIRGLRFKNLSENMIGINGHEITVPGVEPQK